MEWCPSRIGLQELLVDREVNCECMRFAMRDALRVAERIESAEKWMLFEPFAAACIFRIVQWINPSGENRKGSSSTR